MQECRQLLFSYRFPIELDKVAAPPNFFRLKFVQSEKFEAIGINAQPKTTFSPVTLMAIYASIPILPALYECVVK